MNATPRFSLIAVPVLLFGLFVLLPADSGANAPTQATPLRAPTNAKTAAKKAAEKKADAKKSALGKTTKKHHKHKKHHQHKKHHKHKHKKNGAAGSKAELEKRIQQDTARLQRDEKTLTNDTNRLRKALK